MPLIHINPLLTVGYGVEDLPEAVFTVLGGGQRHVDGVYQPTQDNLEYGPGAFTFIKIIKGQELLSVSCVCGI